MSFVPDVAKARDWAQYGMTMFFLGSEQGWMMNGARDAATGVHALTDEMTRRARARRAGVLRCARISGSKRDAFRPRP